MQYIVELVYTDRYFIHSLEGCVGSISRASLRLWTVFKSTDHCDKVSGQLTGQLSLPNHSRLIPVPPPSFRHTEKSRSISIILNVYHLE